MNRCQQAASIVLVLCIWPFLLAAQEQTLLSFGTAPDGNYPNSTLAIDRFGNLYGTTLEGGQFGEGTIFELTFRNGHWIKTILYDFCQQPACADGSAPSGTLALDPAGNLYGTTNFGGAFALGTAFQLTRNIDGTWTQSVIHDFGTTADGAIPLSGMVPDGNGNLYGTTISGGTGSNCTSGGCGTVFELSPAGPGQWMETVLYNFCSETYCADGSGPTAGLVMDGLGNFYGSTAYGGGLSNNGVVFEISPNGATWIEQVLHAFTGGNGGYNPHARLTFYRGDLYGTTEFGGNRGNGGTVFVLKHLPSGQWEEAVIHAFDDRHGSEPLAELTVDQAGNLYGTADSGGAFHCGLVFKLSKQANDRWIETVLWAFRGTTDGFNPHAGLVLDKNGTLYGVTYQGGVQHYGTAFQIAP